ncbi:multidrug effflux MFS transporter [Inquilinus sp. NPDC058860]|uniref:multidrug effflux MFS transporter n=1 Tax=Inquilinus sp. NPDC058860 TaxID=3346652 RepID=UPI003691BE31
MIRPRSLPFLVLLAALVALGGMAIDMYLPALPTIGAEFAAGPDRVQLTMSVYLLGAAAGQLVIGPLSDRFGRRPVLVGGFLLFALASLGAVSSGSVEALIAWRLLQSFGAAVGGVVAMAIVRDSYPVEGAARTIAHLSTIIGLSPAVAPFIGGALLEAFGWRSIFAALAAAGLALAGTVAFGLGETRPPGIRPANLLRQLLHSYTTLLGDRRYLAYVLCVSFAFAGLFTFIAGSPYAVIEHWGVPPTRFGYVFAVLPIGFMVGAQLGAVLGRWLSVSALLSIGVALCCAAGVALVALYGLDGGLVAFMLPVAAYVVGVGIILPQGIACVMADHPQIAGAASAVLGCAQLALSAAVAALAAAMSDGTPLSMAVTMALAAPAALLAERIAALTRRPQPA